MTISNRINSAAFIMINDTATTKATARTWLANLPADATPVANRIWIDGAWTVFLHAAV